MTILQKATLILQNMETTDVWQHFNKTKIILSPIPNPRIYPSYYNAIDKSPCDVWNEQEKFAENNVFWKSKKDSGTSELAKIQNISQSNIITL